MRTPEGYVKADVDKYLNKIGAYVIKPTSFGLGKSGTSDRVCCCKGRFISIEIKREGKKPTALQDRRMDEVRRAGGYAIWGDNAEEIIDQIKMWAGI